MKQQGFTLLEAITALLIVGLGVTALVGALAQERRVMRQTLAWCEEEEQATAVLLEELRRWEQLRSEEARRASLRTSGEDPRLGAWRWQAELSEQAEGQAVGLYHVRLFWREREVSTLAALRILPN